MSFKQRLLADETGAVMVECGLIAMILLTLCKVCLMAI